MKKIGLLLLGVVLMTCSVKAQQREKAEQIYEQAMDLLFGEEEEISKAKVLKAIEMYKKAIQIDPSFSEAYEQLAIELWSLGKKQEGFNVLKEAMVQIKDNAMFFLLQGIFCEDEGDISQANLNYKKAVEVFNVSVKTKKSFDTLFYRSLAYYLLENQEIAIQKFKEGVKAGYYKEEDYDEFYEMNLEVLETMDLQEFIQQSITNKYDFRVN